MWMLVVIKGWYYYWYMVFDIFSCKIVGYEVYVVELVELVLWLMCRISLVEGLVGCLLVFYLDNGSVMKGVIMLVMLE